MVLVLVLVLVLEFVFVLVLVLVLMLVSLYVASDIRWSLCFGMVIGAMLMWNLQRLATDSARHAV